MIKSVSRVLKCLVGLAFLPAVLLGQTEQEQEWTRLIKEADDYSIGAKYDSALLLSNQVALTAEMEENYEFMTRAYFVMASVYYRIRKLDLAIDEYVKAKETARKWGNESFVVRADLGLGVVYHQFGFNALDESHPTYDTVQAVLYLDSAFKMFTMAQEYYMRNAPDNYLMLAYTATNLAGNYYARKEFIKSSVYRKEAIELYERVGEKSNAISHTYFLGSTYLQHFKLDQKNHRPYLDSAKHFLLFSHVKSLDIPLTEVARNASKDLAFVHQYLNNTDSALYYWNLSDSLLIEIYSSNYEDRVLEYRAQYETASAELEAEQQRFRALQQERNKRIVLIISIAVVIIFSIWLYIIDQKRKNIKAIAAKNEELNKQRIDELLQQQEIASLQGILEGQEQERKRVAIDLHDRLGGILSMVKLHFSAVEEKLPQDNPEKKKFLTASELLDLAAGEVRNISHNLLSGVLAKFGLVPALKDLADRINESGEIKLHLIQHNLDNALNGEQELQLYRIVQELISNILKHSEAKEATIQLIRNEDSVNLIVEDDGKGFNPNEGIKGGGIGLSNLKARVNKLNGNFHIDSGKGAGTSISIDIPIIND